MSRPTACSTLSAAGSYWLSPASSCRWAPSSSNARTQTLECVEAGLVLSVSYTQVEELYVQNPAFGFYFLRLATARLFENIAKLEQRLAQRTASAAAAPA